MDLQPGWGFNSVVEIADVFEYLKQTKLSRTELGSLLMDLNVFGSKPDKITRHENVGLLLALFKGSLHRLLR